MSEFIQTVIILAIIAVMGFFLYIYYKKNHSTGNPKMKNKDFFKSKNDVNKETPETNFAGATRLWSDINVCELNRNGKVVRKTGVMIHPKGFTIGSSEDADFRISEDEYVSRIHLRVGKDDKGYFIKDTSMNGTEFNGKTYHSQAFDLPFDKVIYIGNTPLVFTERKKERLQKESSYVVDGESATKIFASVRGESDPDFNELRR